MLHKFGLKYLFMRPTVQQPLTVAAVPFALFPFWRPLLTEDPVMAATVRREGKFFDEFNFWGTDFCFWTLASYMRFFPLISESSSSGLISNESEWKRKQLLMIFKKILTQYRVWVLFKSEFETSLDFLPHLQVILRIGIQKKDCKYIVK